jgi:hypothetical protein
VPTESQKQAILDDYVGKDDVVSVYRAVHDGLLKLNFSEDKANRYAWFCQDIYKELKDQHDVVDGLKKVAERNELLPKSIALNLVRSTEAIKDSRLSAGMGVIAPFVDRAAAIARLNGIELDECSLSITKVALDIGGAGTGALSSAVGGLGIPLLALSVIATFNDSYTLAKACKLSKQP